MKTVITLLLIALFATITLASSLAEENPFVWILSDSAKARKFMYSDDPWWTPVLQAIAAEEQKKAVSAPIKSTPQQPVEEKHLTELGNIIAQQLKNKQQNTATTQEDDDWDEFLTVIKAGVKEYVNKHWDAMPESDKGIWKSIWNVVKGVGKGAVKNYVNTHWDEENDKSPKLVLNKLNNSTRVVRPKKRQNRKVNLEKLIRKFLKNRKTTRKPRRMINRKSRNAERRRNLRKLIKKLLLKKEKRNTRRSFRRNGGIDKAMKRLRSSFKQLKNKKNRKTTTKKSLGDHHFDNNVIPNPWFPVVKFLFKDGQ
ncbi:hypothetical protein ABK040_002308 [Willaertia magna]